MGVIESDWPTGGVMTFAQTNRVHKRNKFSGGQASSYYDLDEIRAELLISDVLEEAGLERGLSGRFQCPFCASENPTVLAIYQERAYCHRCRQGGDVIDIIGNIYDLEFKDALKVAARLAGVEPGAPPSPEILAKRKAERAKRAAERAAKLALKRDQGIIGSTEKWHVLQHAWWRDARRRQLCAQYLASRGLDRALELKSRGLLSFAAWEDGAPTIPIYGFDILDPALPTNPVVNLAWRRVEPDADPKVMVRGGCTTTGTFGESWRLKGDSTRIALVEGVIDYLTAAVLSITDNRCGWQLVLGAHSAGRIPMIVSALADHPILGHRYRATHLVLVSHDDGPGGAGETAEQQAMHEAASRGMAVSRFDLEGHKDLNDWFASKTRRGA